VIDEPVKTSIEHEKDQNLLRVLQIKRTLCCCLYTIATHRTLNNSDTSVGTGYRYRTLYVGSRRLFGACSEPLERLYATSKAIADQNTADTNRRFIPI
jgi:hypothetical protein